MNVILLNMSYQNRFFRNFLYGQFWTQFVLLAFTNLFFSQFSVFYYGDHFYCDSNYGSAKYLRFFHETQFHLGLEKNWGCPYWIAPFAFSNLVSGSRK